MDFLTINHVAELSGVSAHTLRAWEKRYSAVTPNRTSTGRRTYSFKDVEKIRTLKTLTDSGFTISQIANLDITELKKLTQQSNVAQETTPDPIDNIGVFDPMIPDVNYTPPPIDKILTSIRDYDLMELNTQLSQARVLHGARSFIFDIVSPLLVEVGRLVNAGQLSISQEHAFSAILKGQIHQIIQTNGYTARKNGPKIILATPEGDIHEFGILICQVICCNLGLTPFYIGPHLPANSLAEAADAIEATHIVIGTSEVPPEFQKESVNQFINTVVTNMKHKCDIWVGGPYCFNPKIEELEYPIKKIYSFAQFEKEILMILKSRKKAM
ncbi:MAG: MerR family transcriptional regulator [Bdellovibrionales bacterium]|nr:MerR family transcriptional regulator [Bdellovibrionales bacterium]